MVFSMNKQLSKIFPLLILLPLVVIGISILNRRNDTESVTHPSDETETWQTYVSETHNLSIKHPADVEVRQNLDGSFSLTKIGPTQAEYTEFYDGISLIFNSTSSGSNLKDYAQRKYDEAKTAPVTEEISSLNQTQVAGFQGYEYKVRAIGESIYIYLSQSDNRVLEIVNSTVDPTDQGFNAIANKILSTLAIR